MTQRRVVIGKYNDGVTFGLRVSLPGNDALTGDSSAPGTFSFDSEWTDIAQIYQVGLTAYRTSYTRVNADGTGITTANGFAFSWVALGYRPFVEARILTGAVVNDDYLNSSFPSGSYLQQETRNPDVAYIDGTFTGQNLLYIIYKIPVPSG